MCVLETMGDKRIEKAVGVWYDTDRAKAGDLPALRRQAAGGFPAGLCGAGADLAVQILSRRDRNQNTSDRRPGVQRPGLQRRLRCWALFVFPGGRGGDSPRGSARQDGRRGREIPGKGSPEKSVGDYRGESENAPAHKKTGEHSGESGEKAGGGSAKWR